jgi:hypothetical protein
VTHVWIFLGTFFHDQDSAYWEAHVELQSGSQEVWFGVATKKDQKFYRALEEQEEGKQIVLKAT